MGIKRPVSGLSADIFALNCREKTSVQLLFRFFFFAKLPKVLSYAGLVVREIRSVRFLFFKCQHLSVREVPFFLQPALMIVEFTNQLNTFLTPSVTMPLPFGTLSYSM